MNRTIGCLLFSLLLLSATVVAGESVLLDSKTGFWRTFITYRTPVLVDKEGKIKPLLTKYHKRKNPNPRPVPVTCSGYPEDKWKDVAFDDLSWTRSRGIIGPGQSLKAYIWEPGGPGAVQLICARAKFEVKDPAKCSGLKLALSFQGGAVVHVNGKELAREQMPKGELRFESNATPYPVDAYIRPDGKQLTGYDRKAHGALFAKRTRNLEVQIPAASLRKGVNVVAVEIYRAPINEVHLTAKWSKVSWRGAPGPWAHARLLHAKVTAPAAVAAVPNVGRPKGVQVWRSQPWGTVTGLDYGDPFDSVKPICLVGVRGGEFNGRFVVSSDQAFGGLKVSVTDLVGKNGKIPVSQITTRYALPEGYRFDALTALPPGNVPLKAYQKSRRSPRAQAAMQPVWLTVRVPKTAQAGSYEATITVQAEGLKDVRIPLRLSVQDWTLTAVRDYVSHNNIWQSHESVALRYKVPFWSEKHFELMGQVLELLGPLANQFCVVHVVPGAYHQGNSEGMIRWIDKGNGKYDHDLSVFDKYLDLYQKKLGKPGLLLLSVVTPYTDKVNKKTGKGGHVVVSRLDPATKKVESMEGPKYGTPECESFWRDVLTKVRARLDKRGWMDVTALGTGSDRTPLPETFGMFKRIWKDSKWMSSSHMNPSSYKAGKEGMVPVPYRERVWGIPSGYKAGKTYPAPWKSAPRHYQWAFSRSGSGWLELKHYHSLSDYRLQPEKSILSGMTGIGRVGADFWDIEGRKYPLSGSSGAHLGCSASIRYFLYPGPKGPLPTTRSEMFREGVQIREAIVFLRNAIDNSKAAALAPKIKALLNQRGLNMVAPNGHRNWLDDEANLFSLCGEVASALGAAEPQQTAERSTAK